MISYVSQQPLKGGASMEFIGLDYHKQYTVATKIGDDGQKEQCRLYNTPDEFSRYFDSHEETSVVFESITPAKINRMNHAA